MTDGMLLILLPSSPALVGLELARQPWPRSRPFRLAHMLPTITAFGPDQFAGLGW
jgi:hypothetical protein